MRTKYCMLLAALCVGGGVYADTIYLKDGVVVEGLSKKLPEGGIYEVTSGGNTVFYREDEIERIEENDRDGSLNMAEIEAKIAAEEAELTQKTGLTTEQRKKVLDLLYLLQRSDVSERAPVRDKLVALQKEFDVFAFIVYMFPELSHRVAPGALETLHAIDPARALPMVREELFDTYSGTRAAAIQILGLAGDRESIPSITRGLADSSNEVKIQAAYALANLTAKEATPALIGLLGVYDQRIVNTCRKSLETIWTGQLPEGKDLYTAEAWTEFWKTKEAEVGAPIQFASLAPLVPPEAEFQNE